MLALMPWRVFEEWALFAREEPFGQMALRVGYASAALGNLLAKPKGKRSWQPADFMPDAPLPAAQRPAKDADTQLGQIMMITRLMGGKVIDKRKRAGRD